MVRDVLEPDVLRGTRPVLRGLRGSNAPWLPDITGASKELLEQEVKPLVEQFLKERGLQLSPEKTVITHIEQGFDFLGQTVRKYQKGKEAKFFITPSKKNVKAFLAKIRKHIKKSRDLTAGELIAELNPQIRGWALYHRHVGELGRVSCGRS